MHLLKLSYFQFYFLSVYKADFYHTLWNWIEFLSPWIKHSIILYFPHRLTWNFVMNKDQWNVPLTLLIIEVKKIHWITQSPQWNVDEHSQASAGSLHARTSGSRSPPEFWTPDEFSRTFPAYDDEWRTHSSPSEAPARPWEKTVWVFISTPWKLKPFMKDSMDL